MPLKWKKEKRKKEKAIAVHPLYLFFIRFPCTDTSAQSNFTHSRWTAPCSQRFPNIIHEWQHKRSISPMSPHCNSGSYNNRTSASSCRVSGSPVVLLCLAFGPFWQTSIVSRVCNHISAAHKNVTGHVLVLAVDKTLSSIILTQPDTTMLTSSFPFFSFVLNIFS